MSLLAVCKFVSPSCPVEATLYGYFPNLGASAFLTALFSVLLAAQVILGVWKRTWTFGIVVSIACLGELLGYASRISMHSNPWNMTAVTIQLITLIIAPSFLAAGVYLTLKHVTINLGRQYTLIRPEAYPWVFVLCDVTSIIVQAVGGILDASSGSGANMAVLTTGNNLIIAGISFQVATMVVFGALAVDFFFRWRLSTRSEKKEDIMGKGAERTGSGSADSASVISQQGSTSFAYFCSSIAFAYITILIRCIYRIHEMSGGWGNPAMRNEKSFLLLDGMMIALATVALTAAHPGMFFQPMSSNKAKALVVGGDEAEEGATQMQSNRMHQHLSKSLKTAA